jgi:hypothetical protein
MDNARLHTARAAQEKLGVSGFKRAPQPPHSPDIAPSNFFLFGWLKTQLEWREYNGEDELYEIVDEILIGLSIDLCRLDESIPTLIDGNGDYVS